MNTPTGHRWYEVSWPQATGKPIQQTVILAHVFGAFSAACAFVNQHAPGSHVYGEVRGEPDVLAGDVFLVRTFGVTGYDQRLIVRERLDILSGRK